MGDGRKEEVSDPGLEPVKGALPWWFFAIIGWGFVAIAISYGFKSAAEHPIMPNFFGVGGFICAIFVIRNRKLFHGIVLGLASILVPIIVRFAVLVDKLSA